MSIFEDMSQFLEARLEEFLKTHPNLELQVLEDQLREQEEDTRKLLDQLATEEQTSQQNILKTAQEVQRWHERIAKAEQANRPDLAQAAREREAAFLRQGNQQWAQMTLTQQHIQQTQALAEQLKVRRRDLQIKIKEQAQASAQRQPTPQAWQSSTASVPWTSSASDIADPLEEQFKRWEMEEELDALKKKMGR
ncbi:MAG TPA: TIGR04376 family protein [Stenomitos sp.]